MYYFVPECGESKNLVKRMNLFGRMNGFSYIVNAFERDASCTETMSFKSYLYLIRMIVYRLDSFSEKWIATECARAFHAAMNALSKMSDSEIVKADVGDIRQYRVCVSNLARKLYN